MTKAAPAGSVRARAASTVVVSAVALATGAAAAFDGRLGAVVAVGTILAAVVAVRPVLAAVLVLPCTYLVRDVGLAGLSVSDVVLLGAAVLALPALVHAPSEDRPRVQRALAGYLLLLLPSLALNPTPEGAVEWVHRLVIVAGGIAVGTWLAGEAAIRLSLRLTVFACSAVAVFACLQSVLSGFEPAYPLGLHKNYAGTLFALTLLTGLCAPDLIALRRLYWPAMVLTGCGLLATQSRGAVLGAALGGFIWFFAPRGGSGVSGRKRALALVLAVCFGAYALFSVQEQLAAVDADTNSAGVRQNVEAFTQELWRTSPLVGVGIRYFNVSDYGPFGQASNNAINSELAEAGVVGAGGFILMHSMIFVVLWRRRRSQLGLAALAVFSGNLLHGMFDIYWSSGLIPFVFVLVGMSLSKPTSDDQKPSVRTP